jgi:GT2 family glycosyltransferase
VSGALVAQGSWAKRSIQQSGDGPKRKISQPDPSRVERIMKKLGVVTVTYYSGKVLEAFLQCCESQSGDDWVLFVIDNDSRDDTREILERRSMDWLHVVLNEVNVGVAEGNNQGIRAAIAAGCDEVLLINNDVEFGPDLFAQLRDSLVRNGAHAVTPVIRYHDDPGRNWYSAGEFKYAWGVDARHVLPPSGPSGVAYLTQYAPTCCMIVRSDVFGRIGLMDEKFFVYWDDTDFCYRLLTAGLSLYVDPSINMTHKVSSLTGGISSDFFIRFHHRNQMYYVRKHYGIAMLVYTLLMTILKSALKVAVGKDSFRQFGLRMQSIVSGFSVEVRQ